MGTAVYDANGNLLGIRRTPAAIYSAINALTSTQKTNIWTDFTSGNPQKWATDDGPKAGAIGIGFGIVQNLAGAMTATQKTDMQVRAVTAYVLDNVQYLINPTFDPTISVAGYSANGQ